MNRRNILKTMLGAVALTPLRADPGPTEIVSSQGLRASISAGGSYQVTADDYAWTFAGAVAQPRNVTVTRDSDAIGAWTEIAFDHASSRSSAIRLYDSSSIALFTTRYNTAGANVDPFPSLTSYPKGLSTFSYVWMWRYSFGSLNQTSPWLFYDPNGNAFILSPAANYMTAVTQIAGGAIEAAIDSKIGALPEGFTHRSVIAFGRGIRNTFDAWGRTLTGLSGKTRPASDSIALLAKLSYWTDAGASYYYHPQDSAQYVPTLLRMPPLFQKEGVPVGSMELDSWYYPKGSPPEWTQITSGMTTYEADPALFPNGLGAFQQSLALPLITHARWIDANSPLRHMYQISGNVSTDPRYWRDYANYLAANGVETLEQDWLSGPAVPDFNLTDPYAFLDNMSKEMAAAGRKIVYCMPLCPHILQSTLYDNVVAVRVASDHFERGRWDTLLIDNQIVAAAGLWPFADNLNSGSEKDLLLSTLTGGPVGSGDPAGGVDGGNLRKAVRADGVIVKPDAPIRPLDEAWMALGKDKTAPMIASTCTDHSGLVTAYVFAYERANAAPAPIAFTAESVGVTGPAYVYDYFQAKGPAISAGAPFKDAVPYDGSYYIVAPIGKSGMAFLGDLGKFVSCGRKRIESLSDDGILRATVRFAPGEREVILSVFAPAEPVASVGLVAMRRRPPEHSTTGLYHYVVWPGEDGATTVEFRARD